MSKPLTFSRLVCEIAQSEGCSQGEAEAHARLVWSAIAPEVESRWWQDWRLVCLVLLIVAQGIVAAIIIALIAIGA